MSQGPFPIRPLCLCVALAVHGMAFAQQAGADNTALPAVKVEGKSAKTKTYTAEDNSTATPLGLSLRDTPQSVSVITQQRIQDQGLLNITDVVANVTGLAVHQYETNRAQFTARGFDINNIMIDGVPTTWNQAWSSGEIFSSLAMYDRVEAVRGATGLTTGAGDPGAAINMIRKRATATTLTGTAELQLGSHDKRRVMADVGTALNADKTIRARFIAEYDEAGSETRLIDRKTKTGLATFEADLTPRTLLSGGVSRQENDSKGAMWGGLPVWYADGTRTNWDQSTTTSSDWVRWNSTYTNYFAALEHRFDNGWRVKAAFSRGERVGDAYLSYLSGAPDRVTGLGMNYFNAYYKPQTDQNDLSVQASGPFEAFGRTHELSVGYTRSSQKFLAQTRAGDSGAAPDFNAWSPSWIPAPQWGALAFYSDGRTKQEGLYAASKLSLADPLKLILGARVSKYEQVASDSANPVKVKDEVTPYAGIVFDATKDISVYASYTSIFQPQSVRDINRKTLDPIKGKAIEAGVKGAFLNGKLNATAAVFHIEQDGLGQSTGENIPGTTPPETAYRASKGATSKGFELELNGEVAQGWNASVGYSQFRAKDAAGVDFNSIYPRKTLKLFTTYQLPGAFSAVTVGGGVNYESASYTDAANPLGVVQRIEQKGFALVNLMARYEFSRQLSLQLNASNLTDKRYFRMFAAFDQQTIGTGREVSATLRYQY